MVDFTGSIPTSNYKVQDETDSFQIPAMSWEINRGSERMVNEAKIKTSPDDRIEVGDEVKFYDTETGDVLFGGSVNDIKKKNTWEIPVKGYGDIINQVRIKQVYSSMAPEDILSDIISNNTDLTFVCNTSSGVTLDKYIIDDYIKKAIKDIVNILNWQFRVTSQKEAILEPKGATDSGKSYTQGVNCQIKEWNKETKLLYNKVEVRGGSTNYTTTETFTGDGSTTTFNINYQTEGAVKVLVAGTEQTGGVGETISSGEDYYVDPENKELVFDTAPANGDNIEIDYDYSVPITVRMEDPNSIEKYNQTREKKIERKYLRTFSDARNFAGSYLNNHSDLSELGKGKIETNIDTSVQVGELVRIEDDIKGVSGNFVIKNKKYLYPEGRMILKVGSHIFNIYDWQAKVQDRIKTLEERLRTEKRLMFYRTFSEDLNNSLVINIVKKYRYINDSFILGHSDNGVLGTDKLGDRRGAWQSV